MTRPAWEGSSGIYSCKDCQDRTIGCHSTCEKYISQREAHDEELKRIYENKQTDVMMSNYEIRGKYKTIKRRKHGGRYR